MMVFESKSEKDTEEFAKKIAEQCKIYNVICLYGEMGVGKTTFTKSMAKALGVNTRIISPSYTLIRTHKITDNKKLYHIDVYRMTEESDVSEIEEILNTNNVIIIEWADKIKSILPENRIDIEFYYKNGNEREIRYTKSFGQKENN